ncbi:MAG: hypothetical protein ACHP7H_03895 [Hyphomicrobiales bacterium]
MDRRPGRNRLADACTWAAAAFAAAGAVVAIASPTGGANRVSGVALPLAVGAAVLAANALISLRVGRLGGGLLYAAASLAILYGMILAMSVPVRLAVEGICPPTSACPLGFERPASSAEIFAVYAATACGAFALALAFVAVEARYLRTPRRQKDQPDTPPPS